MISWILWYTWALCVITSVFKPIQELPIIFIKMEIKMIDIINRWGKYNVLNLVQALIVSHYNNTLQWPENRYLICMLLFWCLVMLAKHYIIPSSIWNSLKTLNPTYIFHSQVAYQIYLTISHIIIVIQ